MQPSRHSNGDVYALEMEHSLWHCRWLSKLLLFLCGSLPAAVVGLAASTSSPKLHPHEQIHLVSLEYPSDSRFSKVVKDVWKWKDAVLGDGRDFFVPRTNTLRSLQEFLVENESSTRNCVVISNCARFELLVVHSGPLPIDRISELLLLQVLANQDRRFPTPPLDWPDAIVPYVAFSSDKEPLNAQLTATMIGELASYWAVFTGPKQILEHLCLVAAGMARRPSRPGRPIEFRPFSSRDAHVVLQLKRTLALSEPGSISSFLIQAALKAGKAVRNPATTPEIQLLRSHPSWRESQDVARQVRQTTIEPLVQETVDELSIPTDAIVHLRTLALHGLLSQPGGPNSASAEEKKLVQRLLHSPTMDLRNGHSVNTTQVLEGIAQEVELYRRRRNVPYSTSKKSNGQ